MISQHFPRQTRTAKPLDRGYIGGGANRSHFAHSQLWCLSLGPDRERYEELRAVYNPVRPAGLLPAPPFEEWRGMSDICDHPYCRCCNAKKSVL